MNKNIELAIIFTMARHAIERDIALLNIEEYIALTGDNELTEYMIDIDFSFTDVAWAVQLLKIAGYTEVSSGVFQKQRGPFFPIRTHDLNNGNLKQTINRLRDEIAG